MEQKATTNNQEIDLSYLYKSVKDFFENIVYGFFKFISFFLRNIVITCIVLIIGIGLGIYVYKNDKKAYKSIVVVATNFGSTGYAYNKINHFNKAELHKYPNLAHVNKIEIEPIIDVYSFISDEKENLDIAKYMSENTIEVSKYKDDNNVEKLYRYHKIEYYTDVADADNGIYNDLINFLNDDDYYIEVQKIGILASKNKLIELEKSVENINAVFESMGVNRGEGSGDIKIDLYSQINELMLTKNKLMQQIAKTNVQVVEEEKVVYDVSSNRNLLNKSIIKPVFLVIVLLFLYFVIAQTFQKFKQFKKEETVK